MPLPSNLCSAIRDKGSLHVKIKLQSTEWHESRPQQLVCDSHRGPREGPSAYSEFVEMPLRDEVVSHLL